MSRSRQWSALRLPQDPHSHLTCLDSGSIEDIDVELPADLLDRIERETGYRIESYTLQLNGRRTLEN